MLPDTRPHVDDDVMMSVDLIATKRLLEKERKTALQHYYTEVLGPARQSNEQLSKYVEIVNGLDELGYFTRVLLRELQGLGVKRQFSIPEEDTKDETRKFLAFLDEKVVNKKSGVDVDPIFEGESISVSIVYVARGEQIGPHLAWIKKCIKKKLTSIYLCARGAHNISLVRKLQSRLKSSDKVTEVFCEEFSTASGGTKKRDNICIRYDIQSKEAVKLVFTH